MAERTKVVLEIELTPKWWLRLASNLNGSETAEPIRQLHAQAVAMAFELGGVMMLKTKRRRFIARVAVSRDLTMEQVCAQAGAIVDRLNALDVSCLPGAKTVVKAHRDECC